MKPRSATDSQAAALARKRALIRSLIEQHGWSSVSSTAVTPAPRPGERAASNVIQFPGVGK